MRNLVTLQYLLQFAEIATGYLTSKASSQLYLERSVFFDYNFWIGLHGPTNSYIRNDNMYKEFY